MSTLSPNLNQKVNLGDYALLLKCYGQGTPSIIIETGFGDPGAENEAWLPVIEELQKKTQVCVYDRLGLGSSDPIHTNRRTSQDATDDLHALLTAAKIAGPYVLVGHSSGGYTVRLYAEKFPDEVVGMVLIDASHHNQYDAFMATFPPKAADEPPELIALREEFENIANLDNLEHWDIFASEAQVRAVGDLGDLPLAVVSRSPSHNLESGALKELSQVQEQLWTRLQAELASLSTNSVHKVVAEAGHYVHEEEPQLVTEAVLHVLGEATK